MQAGVSVAQSSRVRHRHELRTLTYVTLDEANGGIIRDLSHDGIGVQAVAAVQPGQRLQVRFELPHPRVRVDAAGEVTWANEAGQCGIRFLELPPRVARRIDEWIFGDLLVRLRLHSGLMTPSLTSLEVVEDDGLILSPAAVNVIELPKRPDAEDRSSEPEIAGQNAVELDWLSRPLSQRGLVWLVNTLTAMAALLLFTLIFLAITREVPQKPVVVAAGAILGLVVLYMGFFKLFAGASPGTRLAWLAGYGRDREEESRDARFR